MQPECIGLLLLSNVNMGGAGIPHVERVGPAIRTNAQAIFWSMGVVLAIWVGPRSGHVLNICFVGSTMKSASFPA